MTRDAAALSVLDEQLGRAACVQHTRVGLMEDAVQVVDGERRVERACVVGRQPVERHAVSFERREAASLEAVCAAREPGEPHGLPDTRARLVLQLEPLTARAPGELRVPVRFTVRRAQESRVAAGRGADRPGRVLLDECHAPVARGERTRNRRAGDPGADDDRAGAHERGVTFSESTSGRW